MTSTRDRRKASRAFNRALCTPATASSRSWSRSSDNGARPDAADLLLGELQIGSLIRSFPESVTGRADNDLTYRFSLSCGAGPAARAGHGGRRSSGALLSRGTSVRLCYR